MTHQANPELLNTVLQLLTAEGSGGFAESIRLLVSLVTTAHCQPVRTACLSAADR